MVGYWMYETSGVLAPAVERYLKGDPLSESDIGALRAYLRQWMNGPWRGPEIESLAADVEKIITRKQIEEWTDKALDAGIDPW